MKNDKSFGYGIGHDAICLTSSKIITSLIALVISMLLSRFRTLEEYGTYSQLIIVTSLFSSAFMLGLPSSISFFLARAETNEEKEKFISLYYCITTLLCVIMGIALIAFVPVIESYFNNPTIHTFYYFLALYPWASVINTSIENVLIVYQKSEFLLLYRFMYSSSLLGLVLAAYGLRVSFEVYIEWFVIVNSLFAISAYYISFRLAGYIQILFDGKLAKNILLFSIPIGLSQIVGTLNIEIDKLMIGHLMSTEQLAIYTNASKELPFSIISAAFTAVLLPRLTILLKQKKNVEAIKLWGYSIGLSYAVIAFVVSIVVVYAKDVLVVLYSEKYLPGLGVFRIYTLCILLRCTYFGIILNANGSTKKILYCSIGSLLLNAILNPLLFIYIGMIGPAIATIISIFLIAMVQLFLTAREEDISLKKIVPWEELGFLTIVNLVFAVFFYFAKIFLFVDSIIGSMGESCLLGIIWITLYYFAIRKYLMTRWRLLNENSI